MADRNDHLPSQSISRQATVIPRISELHRSNDSFSSKSFDHLLNLTLFQMAEPPDDLPFSIQTITSHRFMPRAQVDPPAITEEVARTLVELFKTFDKDGDKKLTPAEFREFLTAAKANPNKSDLAFAIFDKDKSGLLEFEEFIELVLYEKLSETHPRAYFARAFEAFDADKSGKLDAAELGNYLKLAGVPDAATVAAGVIADAGGAPLTFDKLATLLELPPDE
jgi:Ca2+-binding EF-hand superfamily protein